MYIELAAKLLVRVNLCFKSGLKEFEELFTEINILADSRCNTIQKILTFMVKKTVQQTSVFGLLSLVLIKEISQHLALTWEHF